MTETRSFTALAELTAQFIDDYNLTPRYVATHLVSGPYVSILVDGDGDTANLVSEALYWERDLVGATRARVTIDGVEFSVTIYDETNQ